MGSFPRNLRQPPGVNERLDFWRSWLCGRWFLADSTSPPARWDSLFATTGGAGFLDGLFDRFTGFARALLNPANQFILLAFGIEEVAVREFGPFFLQLALGDVPVAFDFECGHNNSFILLFVFIRRQHGGKSVTATGGLPTGLSPRPLLFSPFTLFGLGLL